MCKPGDAVSTVMLAFVPTLHTHTASSQRAGVESRLERDFVRLVRQAGLPEPVVQVVHRQDGRTIARVDCLFDGVVVEVAGHGTHATRRQRQRDAQRHTELTLAGLRVITFTYEDVHERPGWVVARLRQAVGRTAA